MAMGVSAENELRGQHSKHVRHDFLRHALAHFLLVHPLSQRSHNLDASLCAHHQFCHAGTKTHCKETRAVILIMRSRNSIHAKFSGGAQMVTKIQDCLLCSLFFLLQFQGSIQQILQQ